MKPILRKTLLTIAFSTGLASAMPIDLGAAGQYTLLATGTDFHGQPWGGSLILGSEAYIHGNVGARDLLNMGAGSIIYGNADYGSLIQDPGSKIEGLAQTQPRNFWDSVYNDLKNASLQAKALSGTNMGAIESTQTFTRTGQQSVFHIDKLKFGGNHSLTLKGNENDQFVINVNGIFELGAGAAIVLDGVRAENVLFNMHGFDTAGHVNIAAGTMQGTYIAPDASMNIGDGLFFDAARFLAKDIVANLQTLNGIPPVVPPVVTVSEPATGVLFLLGLLGLGLARKRAR